MSLTDGANQ